ncbi:MAG TPA: FtsX-like permease family protein, partial [Thermodesulfobacteriota bacterium]|nr:FtsX-like permease family protein [Thermodesulfobacteriota bacterium]
MRVYFLFIFRHYLQSWRQTLLTILGLGLGVSVFVSIHLTVGASLLSFKNTTQAISGRTPWQVVQDGKGIDERLFPRIKMHPLIQGAAPVIEFQAPLLKQPGQAIWIMGVDFFSETGFRRYSDSLSTLKGNDFLALILTPKAIALPRQFAERHGLKKGDAFSVLMNGHPLALQVASFLESEGPAQAFGGNFGLMDIAQAQEAFEKIGFLDRIDLQPVEGVAEIIFMKEMEGILPPGGRLIRPSDRERGTEQMIRSYQLNLIALSFIAVLVSMYLIYNTSNLSVVRRRKELGILRSVGMLPRQILRLVLWEAAGFGLMGGILGLAGGTALARFLLHTVSRTITNLYVLVGVKEIPLSLMELGLILLLSILMAVVSAYLPARQAAAIEPREVLYQKSGMNEPSQIKTRKSLWGGLGLLLLAGLLTFLPPWHQWPVGGFSATLALTLGFSFLLPDFLRLIFKQSFIFNFFKKRGYLPGWLGINYLNRYVGRITIAMAALMIAITMLISVSLMIRSFRQAVDTWIGQSVSGDLFVGPVLPSNQGFYQFLEPQTIQDIESLQEVAEVYHYRAIMTETQGVSLRLWAGDLSIIQKYGGLAFTQGTSESIIYQAVKGEAILASEILANQLHLKPGDWFPLRTAEGLRSFRIAGIFYDYRT